MKDTQSRLTCNDVFGAAFESSLNEAIDVAPAATRNKLGRWGASLYSRIIDANIVDMPPTPPETIKARQHRWICKSLA
jgi:hypothetical protein